MTDDKATEPLTEAGRHYLDRPPGSLDEWRAAIFAIEAEAAQGAAPRFIPDVLRGVGHRDEHGNIIEDYHMCGCRQVSEGAAPLTEDCVGTHDPFTVCPRCDDGSSKDLNAPAMSEEAAPRAEGLDVERDDLLMRFDPDGAYDGWHVRMEITGHYARLVQAAQQVKS